MRYFVYPSSLLTTARFNILNSQICRGETFPRNCIPEYCGHNKVELQSGMRGAATHGPLSWALYKVEPKSVRICGASRWLKRIFKSNVISAHSLSGDSDFQSVFKKGEIRCNEAKQKRFSSGGKVLGWKRFAIFAPVRCHRWLWRHNGSPGC